VIGRGNYRWETKMRAPKKKGVGYKSGGLRRDTGHRLWGVGGPISRMPTKLNWGEGGKKPLGKPGGFVAQRQEKQIPRRQSPGGKADEGGGKMGVKLGLEEKSSSLTTKGKGWDETWKGVEAWRKGPK